MAIVETIVSRTDCLDVKTEHEGTLLIEYSNPGDFDDVPYSSFVTPPTFKLRIPARLNLHQPRFPEENETMQESDGDTESLMGSIKTQIQLEIDRVPAFMHEKIKLALMHKTIIIGGISFTKEEPYEIGTTRIDNPHRKGSCWLTVRGSYKTNVQ